MRSKSPAGAALKAAFPHTIPILAGFLFLGMTYGVYMRTSGFSFWYPMIMSIVIFGGSLEFVTTSMLLAPFAPVQVFLMAVMIQARHLFYGISMLDRYKGTGWKKPYLIYAMCDETFSVNYTAEIPESSVPSAQRTMVMACWKIVILPPPVFLLRWACAARSAQ